VAGMQLVGSEVKSLRASKASISEAHCFFNDGELFIKGMHIAEYKQSGRHTNHEPYRERKLLLKKKELKDLDRDVSTKGVTIVPLKVFISKSGFMKLEIALVKGKKLHDKRNAIKERDQEREQRTEI
jgi:SsrA-binding protein